MAKRGRPSVEKDEEKQEKYLKMWTQKFFYNKDSYEIADEFDVTWRTVQNALKWVRDNFVNIPSKVLLKGAVWATQRRIKAITEEFVKEKEKGEPSIRNLVELNREIRKDSEQLQKLQNVMKEKFEVDVGSNTAEILKALNESDEEDEERG